MNKKSTITKVLILVLLLNFTLHSATGISFEKTISRNNFLEQYIDESQIECPGSIIDICFSNPYPTLGKPIEISVTLKGNPTGKRFYEMLNISDDYEGLIAKSSGIEWKCGNVTVDQTMIRIGRLPKYVKKIRWYPVVVGNHTLKFKAGVCPIKTKNISVGFDTQNIIYPSIGCPTIINKNESEQLTVAISEERLISENSLDVQQAELECTNGSFIYALENESNRYYTWIQICKDKVEDELIISYNISNVPCGFYNISITTLKDNYKWPHAVKIIDDEPTEYTFIQLTDTHLEKIYNSVDEKNELERIIAYINEEIKPDFVVMSGDLVDWCKVRGRKNFYRELQEVISTCNSPVFTTPGNHERYKNRLILLYMPFNNPIYYHTYLNPLSDYAFEYGNINFVLLDSGHDWSRWELQLRIWRVSPEGSGLTNNQINILENELGNNEMRQIIVMHHPAVDEEDDAGLFFICDDHPSGNNGCIAFNRVEFIDYCLDNNVTLVLTGHTHNNKVLSYLGEVPNDPYEWPLFIQTNSTTTNGGGRVVRIKDGSIESYDVIFLK